MLARGLSTPAGCRDGQVARLGACREQGEALARLVASRRASWQHAGAANLTVPDTRAMLHDIVGSSDEIDGTAGTDEGAARTRRVDSARQAVSDTVVFRHGERSIDGWALNMSRGGLRAALEEPVAVGDTFDIVVGDAEPRPGQVIWVRNQKDGAIVGVSFTDSDGSVPPPPTGSTAPPGAPSSMPGHSPSD